MYLVLTPADADFNFTWLATDKHFNILRRILQLSDKYLPEPESTNTDGFWTQHGTETQDTKQHSWYSSINNLANLSVHNSHDQSFVFSSSQELHTVHQAYNTIFVNCLLSNKVFWDKSQFCIVRFALWWSNIDISPTTSGLFTCLATRKNTIPVFYFCLVVLYQFCCPGMSGPHWYLRTFEREMIVSIQNQGKPQIIIYFIGLSAGLGKMLRWSNLFTITAKQSDTFFSCQVREFSVAWREQQPWIIDLCQ